MNTRNVYTTTPLASATRRDKGNSAVWAVGLLLLLLLPLSQARAQFQDHIWYFGNSTAGINFDNTTNQPTGLSNKYTPFGAEGCFVATNPTTGQLLFYTSGNTIVNRNHVPMQNGNLVFPAPAPVVQPAGGIFNTSVNGAQSVAVIEKPNGVATNDCGKFLYFINDANEWGGSGKPGSIYIGQIDMNANAGLGAVTQQPTRILTMNAFTESMYVVARPDNQGAWLILNSVLNNRIEVYAVTSAGTVTATPVSTYTLASVNWATTWPLYSNNISWLVGSMAYHQSTGKFAMSFSYLNGYNLYIGNFNNTTGALSGMTNPVNFYSPPNYFTGYGTEFSPSGKWLYFSLNANGTGALRAYNMQTNVDIGNINGSGNGWPGFPFLGLKTGPDRKLWVNTNGYGGDPLPNRAVRSTFDVESPVMDGFVSFPLPVNSYSYRFPDFLSLIPPPTALNDQATALTNCSPTSTTITVLANDVNNASGTIYVDQITTQPLHGTATIVNNQLVYTLTDLAFAGTDTVKYLVRSDASCYAPGTIANALIPVTQCPLDFGDAPDSYLTSLATGGASHLITPGLHLGAVAPDIESSGIPATANAAAQSDDNIGSDDEDGVSAFANLCTTSTSYTLTVPVTNTGTAGARLIGWIDFNRNAVFEPSEAATVNAPSSGSYQLVWTGLSGLSAGFSYARLRLTSDPAITNSTPGGQASNGEVEDYRLSITTGGGIITPDITSRTVCSGTQIAINYTTNPVGSQVNWTRLPNSLTGVGNVVDVPTATGTTPVSYTYTAWIASAFGCPSNVVTTVVTVNPIPIITPSVCSQTICSGQTGAITFISSVAGTINWLRVEDGATGTGNISQLFATAGTNTYKIWGVSAAPASCPSSTTITCVIVVNNCCDLVATTIPSSITSCTAPNSGAIGITYSGSQTYQYTLDGGSAQSLGASPFMISGLAAGQHSVVIQAVGDPTCSQSFTATVNGPSPAAVVAQSNSPLCTGNTLSLSATTGFSIYNWSGPNGFNSNQQNPILPNATVAASGSYTVVVTNAAGCSGTGVTVVNIATQPSLTVTAGSGTTICSSQSTTLSVGGSNGASVAWTNSVGQTGTGTSILVGPYLNVTGSPLSLTYTITASAGNCSDVKTVVVTINPAPALQIVPVSAVYCSIENVKITANSSDPTATINWTRTPNTPNPPVVSGSGTGSVIVDQTLPAASYTYNFTATGTNGCSSPTANVPITVQQ